MMAIAAPRPVIARPVIAAATVLATAAIVTATTITIPITVIATGPATLHDRRRAFLQFVDANGEAAQDVLADAGLTLQFMDRRGRGIDVEHEIVALAVFSDPEGEGPKSPLLAFGDAATVIFDRFG